MSSSATTLSQKIQLPTLQEHIDHYYSLIKPRYRSTTLGAISLTVRYLVAFFGGDRRIDDISRTDADQWFKALTTGAIGDYVEKIEGKPNACKRERLADGSVKPHINNARQIFKTALDRFPGELKSNPFGHLRIRVEPTKGQWRFVSRDEALLAINACTDDKTSKLGWQLFIAICRFAGLRKSEALALEKKDIHLSHDPPLIKVYAAKTARQTGRPSRVVPVLEPILGELLAQGVITGDSKYIVDERVPRHSGSDHKTLCRILKRAGVPRWKPAFQVLRACAEVDMLNSGLPERLYARAMGHSREVSRKYYLDKFEDAVLEEGDREAYLAARQALQNRTA